MNIRVTCKFISNAWCLIRSLFIGSVVLMFRQLFFFKTKSTVWKVGYYVFIIELYRCKSNRMINTKWEKLFTEVKYISCNCLIYVKIFIYIRDEDTLIHIHSVISQCVHVITSKSSSVMKKETHYSVQS